MNVNDMMSEPDISGFDPIIDEISKTMLEWVKEHKVDHFLEKMFHKKDSENESREKVRIERWLKRCKKYEKDKSKKSGITNTLRKFIKVWKNWESQRYIEDKIEIIGEFLSFSILRMSESYNVMYYEVLRSSIVPEFFLNEIKRKMTIPYGKGSVGYIARSGQALNIGNTFCDLRGAVGMEDYQLGNVSFMAKPVKSVFKKEEAEEQSLEHLICVVACFFPAANAFDGEIFKQFKAIVEDLYPLIKLAWELEQQKAVNRKFLILPGSQTVLEDITQSYEVSLKALLPNRIGQKENNILYTDPLGLSVATVWEVDKNLNQLKFIRGDMSEEIYLRRFSDVLRES